jgi:CDP-diacylglycerol--glycerol-3-phosphate 3-phosphatidyltransferase
MANTQLPMTLTLARLAAAPVVAGLVLWGDHVVFAQGARAAMTLFSIALVLFILAALTDALDGYLARKLNATSDLGAALDHAADKALTTCTLVALTATGIALDLVVATILILGRDVTIAGLREGLSLSGRALPVSSAGKLKTVVVLTGAGALLATQTLVYANSDANLIFWVDKLSHGALWAGAALALWSGAIYATAAFAKKSQ